MTDSSVWHENTTFWDRVQDFLFPPESIEQATEQVEQLLTLLELEAEARILDSPCGIGRHAVELADRGFQVTAVDATAPYLEIARERAAAAAVDVEFEQADMREFCRPESFNVVINLYTSFGYFEDPAEDQDVLENFYESLVPGGRLVMGLTGKEIIARTFEERTWEERNGAYLLEERTLQDNWTGMQNRWIVIDDAGVETFEVSHRLYSAFELSELLDQAGFSEVAIYGGLDGSAYDEHADRLVAVAEK